MAEMFQLEVVTPEKTVVSESVGSLTAPGSEGEFGVLVGHTPFLTALMVGALTYVDESGKERCVFINGGFAETLPNRVTVLAETAERRCDIDEERAKEAMDRAQKRLDSEETELDFARAKTALMRAQVRSSLAEGRAKAGLQ